MTSGSINLKDQIFAERAVYLSLVLNLNNACFIAELMNAKKQKGKGAANWRYRCADINKLLKPKIRTVLDINFQNYLESKEFQMELSRIKN